MLDALILADRPVKDDTLVGILGGPLKGHAAQADAGRRSQHPLGVHPVQDLLEALTLLANQVFCVGFFT